MLGSIKDEISDLRQDNFKLKKIAAAIQFISYINSRILYLIFFVRFIFSTLDDS
jgi:hypothetical protein